MSFNVVKTKNQTDTMQYVGNYCDFNSICCLRWKQTLTQYMIINSDECKTIQSTKKKENFCYFINNCSYCPSEEVLKSAVIYIIIPATY